MRKSIIGATCACLAVSSISAHAVVVATTNVNTGGGTCDYEMAGETLLDNVASGYNVCNIASQINGQVDDGSGGQISFTSSSRFLSTIDNAWNIGITNPNYTGSMAIFSNQDSGNTIIRATMGIGGIQETISDEDTQIEVGLSDVSFDFVSIAVSELSNTASQNTTSITFYGQQLGGGLVSSTVALDGVFGLETFLFGDIFKGVTYVTWAQEANYHQFDNIAVENVMGTATFELKNVPIPSAVWLFGSGLIGLIGMARRKT